MHGGCRPSCLHARCAVRSMWACGAMRRIVTVGERQTRGASAPNGAGSAVDESPRTARVSVDWFSVTGTWEQASLQRDGKGFSETGRASAARPSGAAWCIRDADEPVSCGKHAGGLSSQVYKQWQMRTMAGMQTVSGNLRWQARRKTYSIARHPMRRIHELLPWNITL